MIRLDWARPDIIHKSRASFAAHQPFPVFRVDNFIRNATELDRIQDELMEVTFYEKCNDLYNFHQSDDLAGTESRLLSDFLQQLYGDEFRTALTDISGIPLNSNIDVTASLYRRHDHLLPHDDQLLGRRIAFILYLVPEDWSEADGGHLDLFDVDSANQPNSIRARILPQRNTLVFFEVSPASYHQVAEILSDKRRLSINGWFHGAENEPKTNLPMHLDSLTADAFFEQRLHTVKKDSKADSSLTSSDLLLLQQWISPSYLKASIQRQITTQFENESQIELRVFLCKSQWARIEKAIAESGMDWDLVGPFNKRRFHVLDLDSAGENVFAEVRELFQSEAMRKLLQILSGGYYRILSSTALVRKFTPGCYTLAYDGDPEAQQMSLDVAFSFTSIEEDAESGATVYVEEEAEDPLCVLTPLANSLTVVLRAEPGTMRFVKYLNSAADTRIDLDLICNIEEVEE